MAEASRSIGQVLALVKLDFPDVTISKIRFLETEGLLAPERAPSGYRRYRQTDVERLRYILGMQKNHYLPLKVIREHLDMMDRGLTPPVIDTPRPVAEADETAPTSAGPPVGGRPDDRPAEQPRHPIRMSRRELLEASGLSEAALIELERQMVIRPRRGTVYYGRDALTLAIAARRLAAYGMDARHLRAVKQAADREAALIEQAIAPYVRRHAQAREVTNDVTQLVTHAHAALMRAAMER